MDQQEPHRTEPMKEEQHTRPANSRAYFSSSVVTIVVSCILSTTIGFIIANSSQRFDLDSVLKGLQLKYDQLFGYQKEGHYKNALIVSLLDQAHQELALKKNFNVISASTQLERREKTEVGTKGTDDYVYFPARSRNISYLIFAVDFVEL